MDKNSADLILFNANVLTMERTNPIADAVVISGGRIVAVGGGGRRGAFRGTHTKSIDCKGKTVVPGFHDAHVHVFALVSSLLSLDCSPSAVSSIDDIRRLIEGRAEEIPEGNWIKGADYNEFYLLEKRHPTRWELDRAAPCHPVKLAHRTRQACVLNSRALSLAGINRETPDPPGGFIDRDYEAGEPTGLLFGMNTYLSENVIPHLAAEELGEGLRQANHLLLSWGITSLQDATAHNGLDQWEHFQRIKDEGKLQPRVTMMFSFDALDQFQRLGLRPGSGDENLNLGMVKIRIDEITGSLNPPQEALNEMVLLAHRGGFQVAIHAIEENTVEAALNAMEHVLHRLPKAGHRHRIEHCSECPPRLLRRLKETQAMVVTQPAFLYYSGERYLS